jgi:hypothetical protein
VSLSRTAVGTLTNDGGLGRNGQIRTAVTEAAETAAGSTASVVAVAPIGITTYDANGDRRRRRCPCGVATADVDVMMMMVGERGGKATARCR